MKISQLGLQPDKFLEDYDEDAEGGRTAGLGRKPVC